MPNGIKRLLKFNLKTEPINESIRLEVKKETDLTVKKCLDMMEKYSKQTTMYKLFFKSEKYVNDSYYENQVSILDRFKDLQDYSKYQNFRINDIDKIRK